MHLQSLWLEVPKMKLIYLKEGRRYTSRALAECVNAQLECIRNSKENNGQLPANLEPDFFNRFRDAINNEFDRSVVKGKNGVSIFHYVGLYDYVDPKGVNLTFFFVPKFLDVKGTDENGEDDSGEDKREWETSEGNLSAWNDCCAVFEKRGRDVLLQAIDRKAKDDSEIDDDLENTEKKPEGVLELAVRMLRDYLENGLYIVQRRELELNGQGEIDWNSTIDTFQPMIKNGRPYYMEVLTEQAYSDEDHYITRLHKCLITHWGRKLEELGLSSVLRVNVPMLSEEELEHLGDSDYQITQINRELNVQFVTKSRETLRLMKELIERASENKALNHESLSFGMTGVEHLWETACAEVLGSELDQEMEKCGFDDAPKGVSFEKYMPRVFWTNLCPCGRQNERDDKALNGEDASSRSKKAGWRLDFIRTWRGCDGRAEKLAILDAKYYCVQWKEGKISGQPGTPDIAKQMFYQMAFKDLIEKYKIKVVNAFLFPEDDGSPSHQLGSGVKVTETVRMESWQGGQDAYFPASAFRDINLFAVRIPGIRLLERYAVYDIADDWFKDIVGFGSELSCLRQDYLCPKSSGADNMCV